MTTFCARMKVHCSVSRLRTFIYGPTYCRSLGWKQLGSLKKSLKGLLQNKSSNHSLTTPIRNSHFSSSVNRMWRFSSKNILPTWKNNTDTSWQQKNNPEFTLDSQAKSICTLLDHFHSTTKSCSTFETLVASSTSEASMMKSVNNSKQKSDKSSMLYRLKKATLYLKKVNSSNKFQNYQFAIIRHNLRLHLWPSNSKIILKFWSRLN